MTSSEFNTEATPGGVQYVIPGTERTIKSRHTYELEGDQLVIPGAEQISTKEHLTRLAEKPIRPRLGQVGLNGTGLFGA